MITHATQEQWDEVERIRLRWLNEYQTQQFTRAEVQAAANEIWWLKNKKAPQVLEES